MKTFSTPSTDKSKTVSRNNAQEQSRPFFAATGPVQAKLVLNAPGDQHEQEADAMADRVLRKETRGRDIPKAISPAGSIRRKCATCEHEEVQRKESSAPIEKEKDSVHRKNDDRDEPVPGGFLSDWFSAQLLQSKGQGAKLPKTSLDKMNTAFGHDFSGVIVHTDSRAATLNLSIRARAFTHGNDIYFAPGQYSPDSSAGDHLLAHELTHVVQQTGTVQRRVNNEATPALVEPGPVTPAGPAAHAPVEPAPRGAEEAATVIPDAPASPAAAATIQILMPEPPMALSRSENRSIVGVDRRAGEVVTVSTDLPDADTNTSSARASVVVPPAETQGLAQQELLTALGTQVAPSPEIEQLCERIKKVIREQRPPDEDSLVDAKPDRSAQFAQESLNGDVQSDMARVQGSYSRIAGGNPPPVQAPGAVAVVPPPLAVAADSPRAENAVPDEIPETDISLNADASASASRMQESGMNSETAMLVQTGPIADARQEQGNLEGLADTGRQQAMAQQQEAITQSGARMADLQQTALASIRTNRRENVTADTAQQGNMKKTEEETRRDIGERANAIFDQARIDVNAILPQIPQIAMGKWEAKKAEISGRFSDKLAEVKRWIDERHSGVIGTLVSIGDAIGGLPSWVTRSYNEAEATFGDDICRLIREISIEVNTLVALCEKIIADAEKEVDDLYTGLGTTLPEWAIAERAQFAERFQGLKQEAARTRTDFTKELVSQASQSVQEAREQIHELREAAKGLLEKIAGFVSDFIKDPFRTIINGLLSLLGISKPAFWRLVDQIGQVIGEIANDPIKFCGNLMRAIAAGFELFFTNFSSHLMTGLFEWLFGKLRSSGIEIPRDFSIPSIFTFFMQLMGISWQTIRRIVGRIVGERNVEMVEQVIGAVGTFMTKGVSGIFDLIQEHLNPMEFIETIKQKAVDYVKESIIVAVAKKIAMLFIPGGAIIEALRGIYHVLKWVFENAARIFTLIESIVGGIANIVAGNINGMATIVENALVRLIAPVIDFLAGYLGFGNLPEQIAAVVQSLQTRVEAIIERVLRVIARGAMSLVGGARAVGGRIANWWNEKVTFRTRSGESHKVYFEGTESNPRLMVASDPITLTNWLQNQHPTDPIKIAAKQKAIFHYDELKNAQSLIRGRYPTTEVAAKIKQALTALGEQVKILFEDEKVATGSLSDPIPLTWYKPLGEYKSIRLKDARGETVTFPFGQKKKLTRPRIDSVGPAAEVAAYNFLNDHEFNIGIDAQMLPSSATKSSPWKKISSRAYRKVFDSGPQRMFRDILRYHDFDLTNLDADHIKDLQFQGLDDLNNLWMLSRTVNQSALSFGRQPIIFKDESTATVTSTLEDRRLQGKYFFIESSKLFT